MTPKEVGQWIIGIPVLAIKILCAAIALALTGAAVAIAVAGIGITLVFVAIPGVPAIFFGAIDWVIGELAEDITNNSEGDLDEK